MDSCDKENLLEVYEPISRNDMYAKLSNIRVVRITEMGAEGELLLGPEVYNENHDVHGGALFTLADTVSSSAAYVWGVRHLGENISCTTATTSFSYLRPVQGGERVICKATLRKMGKTLAVSDVSVLDEKGVEVCCGMFTVCFLDLNRYRKEK